MNDYDEVTLGFDPNKADTNDNGIIDAKEAVIIEGKVDEDLLDSSNLAVPEVNATIKAESAQPLYVSKDTSVKALNENNAIVGYPIDIDFGDDNQIENATIKFNINNSALSNTNLDNLSIFWYDKKDKTVKKMDTMRDAENNTISTVTNHFSTYFVMDTNKKLQEIGFDSGTVLKKVYGQADITFVVDTTGSMDSSINNVKNNINKFVDNLNNDKVYLRLGIVSYNDYVYQLINTSAIDYGWYTNVDKFKTELNNITTGYGGYETPVDGLEMARRMGFNSNASKFIVLLTDEGYHNENRYGIKDMKEEISLLQKDGITVYVISTNDLSVGNDPQGGSDPGYQDLFGGIQNHSDQFGDITSDFSEVLGKMSEKISEKVNDGSWVLLSDLSVVKLDKDPNLGDPSVDTDKDGIPDIKELANKINILIAPDKYVEAWTFNSHPAKADTDEDGLNDKEEMVNSTDAINPDTDEDSLTDGEEVNGMQISTGETIKTNPNNPDTDGDGLWDGIEMGYYGDDGGNTVYEIIANPTIVDTDGDGFNDLEDENPLVSDDIAEDDSDEDIQGDDSIGTNITSLRINQNNIVASTNLLPMLASSTAQNKYSKIYLKVGTKNNNVLKYEKILEFLGYGYLIKKPDKKYTEDTVKTVKWFQREMKLKETDGNIGPETAARLDQLFKYMPIYAEGFCSSKAIELANERFGNQGIYSLINSFQLKYLNKQCPIDYDTVKSLRIFYYQPAYQDYYIRNNLIKGKRYLIIYVDQPTNFTSSLMLKAGHTFISLINSDGNSVSFADKIWGGTVAHYFPHYDKEYSFSGSIYKNKPRFNKIGFWPIDTDNYGFNGTFTKAEVAGVFRYDDAYHHWTTAIAIQISEDEFNSMVNSINKKIEFMTKYLDTDDNIVKKLESAKDDLMRELIQKATNSKEIDESCIYQVEKNSCTTFAVNLAKMSSLYNKYKFFKETTWADIFLQAGCLSTEIVYSGFSPQNAGKQAIEFADDNKVDGIKVFVNTSRGLRIVGKIKVGNLDDYYLPICYREN